MTNIIKSIDYLYFGNGLDDLLNVIGIIDNGICQKSELINLLKRKYRISDFAIDIIKGYKNEYSKNINMLMFKEDLLVSNEYHLKFQKLDCRGFSYTVADDFNFSFKLDSSIDFKIALLTNKNLYYPPRLRRYLPRQHGNHIRELKYPSIAFALGKKISNKLYILIMQSDLFFNGPACIREYIKGWRKVLFSEILSCVNEGISSIYLCSSEDIVKTCHPSYNRPMLRPDIWFQTYDKTARQFNMELIELEELINLQVLNDLPPEYTNKMYHLFL